MKQIEGFRITLQPLDRTTIQLVRNWRNKKDIRNHMEYKQEISEKEQITWFQNLDQFHNQYFVIYFGNQPLGLIHLKNIDLTTKTAESGLFIGENAFIGTGISLGASILLLDHGFGELGLKVIQAKVKNENKIAQQYNQLLGFRATFRLNEQFTMWELSHEAYQKKRNSLILLLS